MTSLAHPLDPDPAALDRFERNAEERTPGMRWSRAAADMLPSS